MNRFPKWSGILSGGICGMLLAGGCASRTKHQWLTFFFDGVPGPPLVSTPARPETRPMESMNVPPVWMTPPPLAAAVKLGASTAEDLLVVHQPYADRNCVACHASNYSQQLKGDISTICIGCHKALATKAKFTHAPMEDGQCTLCNAAHQSKEKFRLVKKSRELCLDCHELEEVSKLKACGQWEDRACTGCHNPHQENRRFLLRASFEKTAQAPNALPDQ